jgi:GntR family transcriptional regulator
MTAAHNRARANGAVGRRKMDGSSDRTVVPLYHQVYVVLRQRIRNNEFDPARPLPGEHQMAEEFGVSRVAIRRTRQSLEPDGLVERRRGVGTFAVPNPVEFRDRYNIGGLLQPGARDDAATESRNLRIATVDPPARVAAKFGSGDKVLLIQRLRGQPFTLLTAWLPDRVARAVGRKPLGKLPVLTAIERAGLYLARTEQAISAQAADDQVASVINLPIGAPVIAMVSLFSDREDRPLALLESQYRPDMYEYRTTMVRRGQGASARWRPLL